MRSKLQTANCKLAPSPKLWSVGDQTPKIWDLEFGHWQLIRGFFLIELLVVISLFGIAASLITVSYLSFDRGQRLKNAAAVLKNDIRLAQNKALAGDKGVSGLCATTSTLGGWYVAILNNTTSYRLSGDCLTGAVESDFGSQTVNLPRGVSIKAITLGIYSPPEVNILFRPLYHDATFHGAMATTDFFDDSGNLRLPLSASNDLVIELGASQVAGRYQVIVKPTGEVSESKP